MVKTVLSLFIGVLMLGTLASCMDDPINFEEGVAQNIFRPNSMGFRFLDYTPGSPTGSIKVYWTNSSSDAQDNFGGYVARILTFDSVQTPSGVFIPRAHTFAEKIVDKTILSVVFENVPINQEYVFAVWGMRNSDPAKPDSLILSRDSAASPTVGETKRTMFDPRPLENPTIIRAASIGPTRIRLEWDKPATHDQGNVLSYIVYFRDPSKAADSNHYKADRAYTKDTNFVEFDVPAALVGAGISAVKEYDFWIKAVRTDSSQFDVDTAIIRWSGGERITLGTGDSLNGALHLGKALFFGNLQGRYSAKEVEITAAEANMKFDDAGENVLVTGLNGTKFYPTFDAAQQLNVAKFSQPLDASAYTEETLLLPKATPQGGWIIYAKLLGRDGAPVARIFLSGSNSSVVTGNGAINVDMIYQPMRGGAQPLPYF
jgi:hypothetical protein